MIWIVAGVATLGSRFVGRDNVTPMERRARALEVLRRLPHQPLPAGDGVAQPPDVPSGHVRILAEAPTDVHRRSNPDRRTAHSQGQNVRTAEARAAAAGRPTIEIPSGLPIAAHFGAAPSVPAVHPPPRTTRRRSRTHAVAVAAMTAATIAIIVVLGLNGGTTKSTAAPPKTPVVRAASASNGLRTRVASSTTTAVKRDPPVFVRTANAAVVSVSNPFLLMVRASATCWMQVTDSTGRALFTATLRPGQIQPIPGSEPVVMKLGYTPAVTVSVDGVDLDLHGLPQTANVAFQTS